MLVICALLSCLPAFAASNASRAASEPAVVLGQLLNQPEGKIDLARAKLTIDRLVDPTVDIEGTLRELDMWAAKAAARFPPFAANREKVEVLISTLYEPGPWNDQRPFGYDYSDPFGEDIKTTLLTNYLATRKGQCVIMPIAFALIAERLGIPVAMSTAPYHLLLKFGDEETGQWMNVEATSGRIYYDSQYEQSMGITKKAIDNSIYLRPYTQLETVALFATATLAAHYRARNDPDRLLEITDLILKANPKDVVAMTIRGDAYYQLIDRDFKSRYPLASQIPETQKQTYLAYSKQNLDWYSKAEALGWRQWSQKDWGNYLKHFGKMKHASGKGTM